MAPKKNKGRKGPSKNFTRKQIIKRIQDPNNKNRVNEAIDFLKVKPKYIDNTGWTFQPDINSNYRFLRIAQRPSLIRDLQTQMNGDGGTRPWDLPSVQMRHDVLADSIAEVLYEPMIGEEKDIPRGRAWMNYNSHARYVNQQREGDPPSQHRSTSRSASRHNRRSRPTRPHSHSASMPQRHNLREDRLDRRYQRGRNWGWTESQIQQYFDSKSRSRDSVDSATRWFNRSYEPSPETPMMSMPVSRTPSPAPFDPRLIRSPTQSAPVQSRSRISGTQPRSRTRSVAWISPTPSRSQKPSRSPTWVSVNTSDSSASRGSSVRITKIVHHNKKKKKAKKQTKKRK